MTMPDRGTHPSLINPAWHKQSQTSLGATRTISRAVSVAICLVALTSGAATAQRKPIVPWPQPADLGELSLEVRALAQEATRPEFSTFTDFKFENRREQTGIRFVHNITEDGGKLFKAVHYDHGNGIMVADFDGDDLIDLFFVDQLGQNEIWGNLGEGRFEDRTPGSGLELPGNVYATAAIADIDNDGDPDIFLTTVRTGNHLLLNDGTGKFTDISEQAGLSYVGHSSGAVFFDYDNDGLLDLFLCNVGNYTHDQRGVGGYFLGRQDAFKGHNFPERTEASILYRNLGAGRFEDVSEATGLVETGWNGDATIADVNGDGFTDLYVTNMQGDDHLWLNQAGKRFVEATDKHFPKNPWGAMGVKFFDWNNDTRLDLMLTDMHSDMSREVFPGYEKLKSFMLWTEDDYLTDGAANNIFGNAFWQANGDGSYSEISDQIGAENYWPWGLSTGDLNADGFEDMFIASGMNYPYRYGINTVLINDEAKTFRDAEFILGIEPRRGNRNRKPMFDLACGGADSDHQICKDMLRATYAVGEPVLQNNMQFTVAGTVGTRSSVIFDLDQDGDVDIVTNEFNDPPQVFISNLASQRQVNWLEVSLTGTTSNRDAIGATVTAFVGERKLTKYHDGKSGYLSQSGSHPIYFGLGEATEVDRIEVAWPSGTKQTVRSGITVGARLDVTEPDS